MFLELLKLQMIPSFETASVSKLIDSKILSKIELLGNLLKILRKIEN
tara:strand:- start:1607 stop:1747 length:141 start_codon:yes stop_codon:yes gene_type:complete